MGSVVKDLGLHEGTEVTETQLALQIGHGRHPVTGDQLGRAYPVYKLDPDDPKKKPRKAVAGFDYTFSMPKSASVLWAVADAGTQAIIADARHAAVRDVVTFMERELAATRMGAGTPDGAVAQVETTGLVAAAYDHWDSRASDPHLHTHVVISNKVLTARDHKWRSLDSRAEPSPHRRAHSGSARPDGVGYATSPRRAPGPHRAARPRPRTRCRSFEGSLGTSPRRTAHTSARAGAVGSGRRHYRHVPRSVRHQLDNAARRPRHDRCPASRPRTREAGSDPVAGSVGPA